MTRKFVIELPLVSAAHEMKIMKICMAAEGMESVKFIREGREGVEITGGEGINEIEVTNKLRKKVNKHAKLVSLLNIQQHTASSQ